MFEDCKIVIDRLKLCYKRDNENQFWRMMAEQPDHLIIGDFDLVRGQADGTYEVIYGVFYAQHEFGTLLFDRFSDKEKKYCWLSIRNQVFYSNMMSIAMLNDFQDAVGFEGVNNITQLDLACDLPFNPVPKIKKLLKREDVFVVRCGTKIEDKKQVIDGLFFLHPTSGLKELAPTLYFSDTDKRKSFVVYDKNKEIQRSNKAYIADYYGNPRRLHRLEIRLTSDELFRFFKKNDISPSVDLLIDQSFLKSMYDEFLFRLLHFSYKRKSIGLLDAVLAMKEGYDIDVKMRH